MPYTFLFFMLAIFSIPGCLLITFIFYYFIFPSLLSMIRRKKPPVKRSFSLAVFCAFVSAFLLAVSIAGLGIVIFWFDAQDSNDYWKDNGLLDMFRMPLEYPYELVMIDDVDNASIEIWQGSLRCDIDNITHYDKHGYLLFGKLNNSIYVTRPEKRKYKWFYFDLSNGDHTIFDNEQDFIAEIHNRGIVEYELKTVWQNWREYWANPRDEEIPEQIENP